MTRDQTLVLPERGQPGAGETGSLFFIGNATLLIRLGSFAILTDPTFIHRHEQVSIGYGMHTTRLTNPAIDIGALPPLDFVLLSHFHGDHFDQVAERDLDRVLPIITTPEAADQLRERGFAGAHPLERWAELTVEKGGARLRVTAMPGRHGPSVVDFALPDVMGSLIEFQPQAGARPFRLYITGDTLIFDDLHEIPRRYPEIDLALLHLGGTRVLGMLVTMDAEQGVQMLQIVNPRLAIPVHYNDYDVFTSSLADFQREVQAAGLEPRVRYLYHGDTFTLDVTMRA